LFATSVSALNAATVLVQENNFLTISVTLAIFVCKIHNTVQLLVLVFFYTTTEATSNCCCFFASFLNINSFFLYFFVVSYLVIVS